MDMETNVATDVYGRAFATNLLKKDVEQTILVVLARAGYERRRLASGTGGKLLDSSLIMYLTWYAQRRGYLGHHDSCSGKRYRICSKW